MLHIDKTDLASRRVLSFRLSKAPLTAFEAFAGCLCARRAHEWIKERLESLSSPEQPASPGSTIPVLTERRLNAGLVSDVEQQSGK
jgi:hypothetical protein